MFEMFLKISVLLLFVTFVSSRGIEKSGVSSSGNRAEGNTDQGVQLRGTLVRVYSVGKH